MMKRKKKSCLKIVYTIIRKKQEKKEQIGSDWTDYNAIMIRI